MHARFWISTWIPCFLKSSEKMKLAHIKAARFAFFGRWTKISYSWLDFHWIHESFEVLDFEKQWWISSSEKRLEIKLEYQQQRWRRPTSDNINNNDQRAHKRAQVWNSVCFLSTMQCLQFKGTFRETSGKITDANKIALEQCTQQHYTDTCIEKHRQLIIPIKKSKGPSEESVPMLTKRQGNGIWLGRERECNTFHILNI